MIGADIDKVVILFLSEVVIVIVKGYSVEGIIIVVIDIHERALLLCIPLFVPLLSLNHVNFFRVIYETVKVVWQVVPFRITGLMLFLVSVDYVLRVTDVLLLTSQF